MDIVSLVSQSATPEVLGRIAGLLGISEAEARAGLGAAVPGVLAGLLGVARRPGAGAALGAALAQVGGAGETAELIGRDPAAAAAGGAELLESILGGEAGAALARALGAHTGLPGAAAGSLLGLAGALALGTLGREAGARGLDATGALGLLERQKDAIGRALPAGLAAALGGTGLPGTAGSRPAAIPPQHVPAPPPPARPRGWTRWLAGLVALALVAWVLMRVLAPSPVAETSPAAAPAEAPAMPADPMVVGDVDVGAQVRSALGEITTALAGVTDAASATAAMPALTEARDTLAGLDSTVSSMSEDGRAALRDLVTAAMPAIEVGADNVMTDSAAAEIAKPVIDDILSRLAVYAA